MNRVIGYTDRGERFAIIVDCGAEQAEQLARLLPEGNVDGERAFTVPSEGRDALVVATLTTMAELHRIGGSGK